MGYEQMEFDVTLSGDRELKDNVGIAVEFACRQVAAENRKTVESNHEDTESPLRARWPWILQ